ncbi:uncharacterized protein N7479_000625 [Penicillium vulpinum]|uniref:Rhodopsin domain-containing protein n=1 Tax=Penicillium vulpinum TaxID=29845 RepID=A0A1V6S686_9EURO|nr:uncharacterized protein N7479_000625 [Penicillium vulpinum]KAJ5970707.1 hypothetical protein N7479_000625 [Penicillium vulpinum]OQE09239.1 hypothetical protein PENVUL_c007G10260 [Penicillium vulpinum]
MYVVVITSVFTALAIVCVALRLYTRFYLLKAPGLDDLIITAALFCAVTSYAFIVLERKHGLGIPTTEISTHEYQLQLYWLWLSVPFYNLSMILAKISALTLFARLFHPRSFLIVTYFLIAFLTLTGLWTTLSGFIYCIPIHDFWNPSAKVRKANCLPDGPVWFTNAGIQTVTDMVIVVLPLPLLWKLHLPRRQKWGILIVFSLGICIVGTSAGRLFQLSIMVGGGDFTQANAQAALWSSLEANISIICICLPPLHPLLSKVFSFFFLPQPVHSSSSKRPSNKSKMAETAHGDGDIWCNQLFNPATASYSASISKADTNELEEDTEEGIRVVRELRLQSDSVPQSANGPPLDLEMGTRSMRGSVAHENPRLTLSAERDFGDFEFPDYKENMNAPI